jgi:hypothetical protein
MSMSRVVRAVVAAAVVLGTTILLVPAAMAADVIPADPTNAAAALATGGIAVTWADNADNEAGFVIERSWGSQDFGVIGAVAANVTSFTDAAYWISGFTYRVRAYNDRGFSGYAISRPISLVSTNTTISITSLTAQPPTGAAPLTVTLTAAFGATTNPSTVTWYFGDGTTVTTSRIDPGSTVTHTYATFATFAATVVVTAPDGAFGRAMGGASTLVAVGAPPLSAPSDLIATSSSKRTVVLSWTNPLSDANEILIFRCPTRRCSNPTIIAALGASATSFTDTSVKSGVRYDYWLIVRNAAGETSGSLAVSVKAR